MSVSLFFHGTPIYCHFRDCTPIFFVCFSGIVYSTVSETGVGGIDIQNARTPNRSRVEKLANAWLRLKLLQLFLPVSLSGMAKGCLTVSQCCTWLALTLHSLSQSLSSSLSSFFLSSVCYKAVALQIPREKNRNLRLDASQLNGYAFQVTLLFSFAFFS